MASKTPWDSVDKKMTKNHISLFFLPNRNIKTNAHKTAKTIECVKPRCPNGCKYGIPNLKPITSKSGSIEDNIASNNSNLQLLLSINFDKVNPTALCPKIDANYILFLESMIMVTGPSFKSSTFISAPNSPVCTGLPKWFSSLLTKVSYSGIAISGFAALI